MKIFFFLSYNLLRVVWNVSPNQRNQQRGYRVGFLLVLLLYKNAYGITQKPLGLHHVKVSVNTLVPDHPSFT